MKVQRLTYDEYWGYYWRITARHKIPGIFKWDQDLVDLITKQCDLPTGATILDLGCAGGDQAKLLARKGYNVTGIDNVSSLIEFAREAFWKEALNGQFLIGDMRTLEYKEQFDLCVMLGTFGLHSEKGDRLLLEKINRSLKQKGQAFIDYLPLESFSKLQHARTWHAIDGGYALTEQWFDVPTSTYHTRNLHILFEGRIIEAADEQGYGAKEVVRCYGDREIELLAETTGFRIKAHLSKKNVGDPDHMPEEGEPRGILILEKSK